MWSGFFRPCRAARILVPWLGIELVPSAVEAQSPNHWTAREFSTMWSFNAPLENEGGPLLSYEEMQPWELNIPVFGTEEAAWCGGWETVQTMASLSWLYSLEPQFPHLENGGVDRALWDPYLEWSVRSWWEQGWSFQGPVHLCKLRTQRERQEATEALIPEQRFSVWAASQNHLGGFKIPDAQAASQTKMSKSLRLEFGQQMF